MDAIVYLHLCYFQLKIKIVETLSQREGHQEFLNEVNKS